MLVELLGELKLQAGVFNMLCASISVSLRMSVDPDFPAHLTGKKSLFKGLVMWAITRPNFYARKMVR